MKQERINNPKISLEQVVNDINSLRKEALLIAENERHIFDAERFYDVLMKYVYYHNEFNSRIGLFPKILFLLEKRLSEILNFAGVKFPYYYTFWFNYNPRYFSNEQLGRIINTEEIAYRVCRGSCDDMYCDILNSENKNDYNAYYFNRVIGQGSKLKEYRNSVVSVQEILSKHNEIEVIKVYKDEGNHIVWTIKNYGNDNWKDSIDGVEGIFDNTEQSQNYIYFLKKTFGIFVDESEQPPYLVNIQDEFEVDDSAYVPNALYICNLSAPFSTKDNYSGSIMFASNSDFDPVLISREINNIKSVVGLITDVEAKYLTTLNRRNVILQSTKSAKAAIMSRNMSHNLGSHVMSYLKQHLGSVKDIISDGILADLVIGEAALKSTLNNTTENTTLPFLMGVGHFVSYLQERQDFIATIATDYIPYFATVNFKDDIYDELNPDKRAERHTERKNGKTDNILLGNIARSEGLGRDTQPTELEKKQNHVQLNDIVLKFRSHFNGNPVDKYDPEDELKVAESSGYALQAEKNRIKAEEELEQMREYDLSLPGGITGRQAVFSILENVIRNAAKHGKREGKHKLELTFDIFTNKDYDRDRIPNNDNINGCLSLRSVLDNFYFKASDADDLFFMTITDNCDFSPLALFKLQQGLKEKYVEDVSGRMKDGNKGLKEMRISAAWLRSIHDEQECCLPQPLISANHLQILTDEQMISYAKDGKWPIPENIQKKKAPIIYARICDPKDDFGFSIEESPHLQYIICLNIPKRVAVVSSCFDIESKEFLGKENVVDIQRRLIKNRWKAFTCNEFVSEKNKSYEFIICDDTEDKSIFDKIRPIATARTFCFSQIESIKTPTGRTAFYENLKRDEFFKKKKGEISDPNTDSDSFVMQLYKILANYNDNEIITVDNKDSQNHLTSSCDKIRSVDSAIENYTDYIYRRHHESEIEFNEFMSNCLAPRFVEGITGSNSSDRLVCHEKLDEMWFYRHLHAMKQHVAIFDERLFSKITRLEESSFIKADDADTKNNSALAAIQRGIRCFTFIRDPKNERVFRLMGVSYSNGIPQYDSSNHHCKCTRIATLSYSNEVIEKDGKAEKKGLEVNFSSEVNPYDYEHLFDFITIHQGLLDKLYETFGIKGSSSEKLDKELLTNKIFSIFSRLHDKVITIKNGNEESSFLPGLIIHSGRSKPSKSDMPQKLPFIQYAALEHATLDCKYSLIELLDYARYEQES